MPKLGIEDAGRFDVEEGREAWRGENCCTAPVVVGGDSCDDAAGSGPAAGRAKVRRVRRAGCRMQGFRVP